MKSNDAPFLVDVTRLIWRRWRGRHPTGIDRVTLAYLDEFGNDAQAVVQHRGIRRILDRRTSSGLFRSLAEPGTKFRPRLIWSAVRSAGRRSCDGGGRLYLNVGHTGLNDPGFRRWVRDVDVRPIYLIHDLIPITHPEYCRSGEREKHVDRIETVLRTASGIITNSEATLRGLEAFGKSESLPSPPAIAALLGCKEFVSFAEQVSSDTPPTFLILGTIEPRKNHLMLLQVWTRITEQFGARAPRLLIIGHRGWECEQTFDLLDRSEALRGTVVEISHCSDEMLATYLASARALLFPSLVEGYGLPIVEALGAGIPVIASDLPVFREIAGNIPEYLDALDGPAWERATVDYAAPGSAARAAQLERLAGYRPPTWQDHFAKVRTWLSTL